MKIVVWYFIVRGNLKIWETVSVMLDHSFAWELLVGEHGRSKKEKQINSIRENYIKCEAWITFISTTVLTTSRCQISKGVFLNLGVKRNGKVRLALQDKDDKVQKCLGIHIYITGDRLWIFRL